MARVNPQTIPQELKDIPRWVIWKIENRKDKQTKVPYCAFDPKQRAKVDNKHTWSSFEVTWEAYQQKLCEGIGLVLSSDDELYGIDLDNAYDPSTDKWDKQAKEILGQCQTTYAEFSPSGRGVHIYGYGKLNKLLGRRKGNIEIYENGRYLTVTGWSVEGHSNSITEQPNIIDWLAKKVFANRLKLPKSAPKQTNTYSLEMTDDELLERARNAANGSKFSDLYDRGDLTAYEGDQSAADLALCVMLAFWVEKDASKVDLLFRNSALMRQKWDTKHATDGSTYGQMTIAKALASVVDTYSPDGVMATQLAGKAEQIDALALKANKTLEKCLTLCKVEAKDLSPLEKSNLADQVLAMLASTNELSSSQVETVFRALKGVTGHSLEVLRKDYKALSQPRVSGDLISIPSYAVCDGVICQVKELFGLLVETPLCNFDAWIAAERKYDDGTETFMVYSIAGVCADGTVLPTLEVAAGEYNAMNWVSKWGTKAVIEPGIGAKDCLRAAIQLLSIERGFTAQHVYRHTGWRKLADNWCYLHNGGAIGCERVSVDLGELNDFVLPTLPKEEEIEAVRASLLFLEVAPLEITVPVFAATYRAPLAEAFPVNLSVFVEGSTGARKTALTALAQAHYGAGWNGENLATNWTGTANAIEKLAFMVKDAVLVIDDFNPTGKSGEVDRYHSIAERVLRAQGNQAGRMRMRVDGSLKPSYYPRGVIISSGEDQPRGHSLRARVFFTELKPGDVDLAKLSQLQEYAANGLLAKAMTGYLNWLAPQMDGLKASLPQTIAELRTAAGQFEHGRTPEQVAHLQVGLKSSLRYAEEIGAISSYEAQELNNRGDKALITLAERQATHQRSADPIAQFIELLASALAIGKCHLRSADTGDEPSNPQHFGWEDNGPKGDCIGWLSPDGTEVYLEQAAAHACVQKFAADQRATLPIPAKTLFKRMAERGELVRADEGKSTTKMSIAGARRRVVVIAARKLVDFGSLANSIDLSND